MTFVSRKITIPSRFRQRGNIVSRLSPPPPPGPVPEPALAYEVKQSAGNPENVGGAFRFDCFFKPDGTRVWTWRDGGSPNGSFNQYDVSPPWSIDPGSWTNRIPNLIGGSLARTFAWNNDGTWLTLLTRWFSSFRRLDTRDQTSTPYDVTVLGPVIHSKTGFPSSEFNMHWKPGGLIIYITRLAGDINAYSLTTPYDITTINLTPVQFFDAAPDAGNISQLEITEDGQFLYSVNSGNFLVSWELATPFDISTATNYSVGLSVILPTPLQIPRGMIVRPDTLDIFLFRDQASQNVRCFQIAPPLGPGVTVGAGVAYGQIATAGDMVFALPAHDEGDLLLLTTYIARSDDINNFLLVSTPGWVEVPGSVIRVTSGSAMTQRSWTKFADGVETTVTINNQYAGGAGFSMACVPCAGVRSFPPAIFDGPVASKLQNNSSNPTATQRTTIQDAAAMVLFCGHSRTFATYAPPTGYDDNAKNSFSGATVYACSKIVSPAGLETPGPWNTTGVNAGADNLMLSVVLKT